MDKEALDEKTFFEKHNIGSYDELQELPFNFDEETSKHFYHEIANRVYSRYDNQKWYISTLAGMIINWRVGDDQRTLFTAAKVGYLPMVEDMVEIGVADEVYDNGLCLNFEIAIIMAAGSGHSSVVERLLELADEHKVSVDYNRVMNYAASGGLDSIVQKMLDLGATAYDGALYSAAVGGHLSIVKKMVECGAREPSVIGLAIMSTRFGKEKNQPMVDYLRGIQT